MDLVKNGNGPEEFLKSYKAYSVCIAVTLTTSRNAKWKLTASQRLMPPSIKVGTLRDQAESSQIASVTPAGLCGVACDGEIRCYVAMLSIALYSMAKSNSIFSLSLSLKYPIQYG